MKLLFENWRKFIKEEDTDIDSDGDTDVEDVLAVAQAAATQGTAERDKDPNIQKIEDIVYSLPNVTRDNFTLNIQHDPELPGEYKVFHSEYAMSELASLAGLRMSHEITSMFEDAGFEVGETWNPKEPIVLIDPKEPR
jgi:hypothetical protein